MNEHDLSDAVTVKLSSLQ